MSTSTTTEQVYSLKRVEETLGLSRAVVLGLIAAGFVVPTRGPRNAYRFSFRDLMLLRTAHALRQARIPSRRILRSLGRLRARLPADLPLSGLRITAVGADVAVRDRNGAWEAETGQRLIDFEVVPQAGRITLLAPRRPDIDAARRGESAASLAPRATSTAAVAASVDTLMERARRLEPIEPSAAEAAYRGALALRPDRLDAALDLGAMLCERGRAGEAAAVLSAALVHHPREALLHFNRAIADEDRDRPGDALAGYERAIALDAGLADAHFNAGRLSEQRGDAQRALRHFNAYRRLRSSGAGDRGDDG